MASSNETKKPTKKKTAPKKSQKSPLIGNQAKPAVLDSTTKLDIDLNKTLADNIIGSGLNGTLDTAALENFTTISNSRDQVYQLIDTMAKDSSVSSILRTYAEDVCETADNGHIMWCESSDPNISKFVNYLLNVMNVDKNIFSWTYCLLKYGDVYLRLFRDSDYDDRLFSKEHRSNVAYGQKLNEDVEKDKNLDEAVKLNIHTADDSYSYYVEMVADPGTMFELTKYGKTYGYIEVPNSVTPGIDNSEAFMGGTNTQMFNYRLKSSDINVYQADDFVHACLEDNFTRFPETVQIFMNDTDYNNSDNGLIYNVKRGKSLLYDSYKIWREKSLLENATLLNRITRSSILRQVSVEVGDMPKEQVQQTLRRVKEMMEQKTSINVGDSVSEYNNPGPIENNIYFATHDGKGAITVDSVGGDVNVKDLADLDWWNNKFYSSYGIPKQYFGWTDDGAGFNGGTSLTILSSVYAKGVKRVQNSMIQAVTDAINLYLINKGCKSYLNNFVLKMKAPVTQEELDFRANLTDRISALSNLQSLLTDVEDKGRRLSILKSLVGTLNYGDDIMFQIQQEINAAEEAKKAKEEEEARIKEEEAKAAAAGESGAETSAPSIPEAESDSEDTDLADLDLAPMPNNELPAEEGFKPAEGTTTLTENQDILVEDSEDLPTPEDLNVDFTENN